MARYNRPRGEPFFWWGPGTGGDRRFAIPDLIRSEMLAPLEAALLTLLLDRGVSLFVLSLTSGAGKSTLLDALLRASRSNRQPVYLRGNYETFDVLGIADPRQTRLLVNELSPHLPIYLWGAGVAKFLTAAERGFQLAATAHASDGPSFIHMLTSPPLSVPVNIVSLPKAVAILDAVPDGGMVTRSIREIVSVTPGETPQATLMRVIARRADKGAKAPVDLDSVRLLLESAGTIPSGLADELTLRTEYFAGLPGAANQADNAS